MKRFSIKYCNNIKYKDKVSVGVVQSCFICEIELNPNQAKDVDIWGKCIESGELAQCGGMDRACETVERRWNKVSLQI